VHGKFLHAVAEINKSEMSRTHDASAGGDEQLAAALDHINAVVVQETRRAAKVAHEFARRAQLLQIAADLGLGAPKRELYFFHPDGHAGQIIGEPVGLGKSEDGLAQGFD